MFSFQDSDFLFEEMSSEEEDIEEAQPKQQRGSRDRPTAQGRSQGRGQGRGRGSRGRGGRGRGGRGTGRGRGRGRGRLNEEPNAAQNQVNHEQQLVVRILTCTCCIHLYFSKFIRCIKSKN